MILGYAATAAAALAVVVLLPTVTIAVLLLIRAWRTNRSSPSPALASLARAGLDVQRIGERFEYRGNLDGKSARGALDASGMVLIVDIDVRGAAAIGAVPDHLVRTMQPCPSAHAHMWVRHPQTEWATLLSHDIPHLDEQVGYYVGDGTAQLHLGPRPARRDLTTYMAELMRIATAVQSAR